MKATRAYTAFDGKLFTDAKECEKYELSLMRGEALKPLAEKIAQEVGPIDSPEHAGETILNALMRNAEDLKSALSVKLATNRGRKKAGTAQTEPLAA
ncbi:MULTISPECIES: hypothetical protein [Chromobacterium]|uniref:Uncharacterized protein n=1 Tax=Chromobacterium phragmitis TaxID=2202141 RepID=A0ABV0J0P1_9NEIS|nr:hypothetical protein [Chromobacterium sp. ASV23]